LDQVFRRQKQLHIFVRGVLQADRGKKEGDHGNLILTPGFASKWPPVVQNSLLPAKVKRAVFLGL
jgi:hypothetical protein